MYYKKPRESKEDWNTRKYCSLKCSTPLCLKINRGSIHRSFEDNIVRYLQRCIRTDSGCLEWPGGKDIGKYGRVSIDNKQTPLHRAVWIFHNGPIPENYEICHTCDNPSCSEINHLFCGTRKDNVQDMINKGRGRTYGKTYLTNKQRESVIELAKQGHKYKDISPLFGISKVRARTIATIAGIRRYKLAKEAIDMSISTNP